MNLTERFLRYVKINTQSAEADHIPSTACQWDLIRILEQDMKDLGISDVRVSNQGYVFGKIPSNVDSPVPALGLIAHMDTALESSGEHVNPRIIEKYDGKEIILNQQMHLSMGPDQYKVLEEAVGKDIIVTDGTTLLGADDKAGITEILCAAEQLILHPEIPHGDICIGFTPDEEVGNGPAGFDIDDFGADYAYTVDGGMLGRLEFENFNAATARISIHGHTIHPGTAKGLMVNALLLAMELNALLPSNQTPADTEGYEGFFHLASLSGDIGEVQMQYLIRDHSSELFQWRKELMKKAVESLRKKYGMDTIELSMEDTYYNMKEKLAPFPELMEIPRKAMLRNGVEPKTEPIRGGTDGVRLSFMGLPCPNLCTGSENHHGPYEFAVIQDMEKIRDILVSIAEAFADPSIQWK